VLLWVEEETEVVEDIVEEVMNYDAALHLARQELKELVVVLDLTEPVVLPKVLVVLVDLAVQCVWQRFLAEACQ